MRARNDKLERSHGHLKKQKTQLLADLQVRCAAGALSVRWQHTHSLPPGHKYTSQLLSQVHLQAACTADSMLLSACGNGAPAGSSRQSDMSAKTHGEYRQLQSAVAC